MVIAQQVQHGVHHQIRQLPAVGMAVLLGLRRHALHGDHHVPQGHQSGAGVGVLPAGQLAGLQVKLRETEHIRGPVYLPHIQIDLMDGLVIGQQHVHLTGKIHPLCRQSGADDLADKGPLALIHPRHVGGDGNIVPFCHYFFPFPPFLAVSYSS